MVDGSGMRMELLSSSSLTDVLAEKRGSIYLCLRRAYCVELSIVYWFSSRC